MDWTAISAWISAAGLAVTAASAWVALTELRQNQNWNRRKASEETLSKLILGEFSESLDQLVAKFKWDPIADSKNYDEIIRGFNEDEQFELNGSISSFFVEKRSLVQWGFQLDLPSEWS